MFNLGYTPPNTLLTELHDVQILTFMEGTGLEFYPFSDMGGVRKAFIDDLVKRNKLDLRLRLSGHWMMKTGAVMLYLRPTGRTYDIRYYDRDSYQIYKDADGETEEAWIRYSYPRRSRRGFSPMSTVQNFLHSLGVLGRGGADGQSWVKIRITKKTYERWDYDYKPEWDDDKIPDITAENSLGFVPCIECQNYNNKGEAGKPEYLDLEEEIRDLEVLESGIRTNIKELSNNILITSLREDQIFDNLSPNKDSMAYASGFRSSTDRIKPINSDQNGRRLKRVIGGFDRGGDGEGGDFISQVQIAPLPPNLIAYVDDLARRIRKALGGRDEREVTYTATEVRSQLGEVLATAGQKERSLFKYGFCALIEMAILAEENLFLATGGKLGLSTAQYNLNREVKYRKGPIFVQSEEQKLKASIIGRNNFRAGMNQLDALHDVFPDKSEEELKAMLKGGLPVEYLENMLRVFSMMQNVTDPATNQPLSFSIPIADYIYKAISYGDTDNIDVGQSGATATLESAAYDAAVRTAAKLGLSRTNSRGNGSKRNQSDAVPNENDRATATPTTIDAEQPLPAADGVYNDSPAN